MEPNNTTPITPIQPVSVTPPPTPPIAPQPPKRSYLLWILPLALVAIILGGLGVYAQYYKTQAAPSVQQTASTIDFKTYTNTKYGYSFQYPADHTAYSGISQTEEKLIPASTTSDDVSVAVMESHVFCCEASTIHFSAPFQNPESFPGYPRKTIKLAGVDATEIDGPGTIGSFYKVIQVDTPADTAGNKGATITITINTDDPLLEQILSTFKFTQLEVAPEITASSTVRWKTYTNAKYGFQIDYISDSLDQPEYDYLIDVPGSGGRRLGPYIYISAKPLPDSKTCPTAEDAAKFLSSQLEGGMGPTEAKIADYIPTPTTSNAEIARLVQDSNEEGTTNSMGGTAGGDVIIVKKNCDVNEPKFYFSIYDSGYFTRSQVEKDNYYKAISTFEFTK